nr:unnamed protein product [Callosobruchus analis]
MKYRLFYCYRQKKERPTEILKFIASIKVAPYLSIALRILLILPISVATGEKDFSELKIINHYLRTSHSQTRLNGVAMLAIEHEISSKLNLKRVIREFAEIKVHKSSKPQARCMALFTCSYIHIT